MTTILTTTLPPSTTLTEIITNSSGVTSRVALANLHTELLKLNNVGGISVEGNTVATTINTVNVWEQVAVFGTNNPDNGGTVADHTNDHITVGATAIYHASFGASVLLPSGTNKVFEFEMKTNNGVISHPNIHTDRKISTSGDVGSLPGIGIVSLTAGDTVELWVRNKTDNANITFETVTLSIIQVAIT